MGDEEKLSLHSQRQLYHSLCLTLDSIAESTENPISRYEAALRFIEDWRTEKTDIDGWLSRRGFFTLLLSSAYFAAQEKETGYQMLDEAVRLYLTALRLPDNSTLSFSHPMLNRLKLSIMDMVVPEYRIPDIRELCSLYRKSSDRLLPFPKLKFTWEDNPKPVLYRQINNALKLWAAFDAIRQEERFQAVLASLQPYDV